MLHGRASQANDNKGKTYYDRSRATITTENATDRERFTEFKRASKDHGQEEVVTDWLWLIAMMVSYLLLAAVIITVAKYRQEKKHGKHRDSKRSL